MNFRGQDWRDRRILNHGMNFPPMHYTIANYCTDHKSDLNTPFAQEDILNKLNSIPDPLKKNLADSVLHIDEKNKVMPPDTKEYIYQPNMESETIENPPMVDKTDSYPSLMGITTYISNFFGAISGAMFQRRAKSPVRYYDCSDHLDCRERSPTCWQGAKIGDQNKNGAPKLNTDQSDGNMNKNCRDAVSQCEGKLNAVRNLLLNKSEPVKPKYRRRPRKLFVEPGNVEERFEDAITPEDFVSLANEEYIEYFGVKSNHKEDLCEVDAPKMKTEIGLVQDNDIVKVLPEIGEKIPMDVQEISVPIESIPTVIEERIMPSTVIEEKTVPAIVIKEEIVPMKIIEEDIVTKPEVQENCVSIATEPKTELKPEIISSCEDKLAKLKSLLKEKRQKNTKLVPDLPDSVPESVKDIERPKKSSKSITIERIKDKRFKNPNRTSVDKRKRTKLRKNIQDDMLFANEIDSEDLSLNNSPIPVSTIPETEEDEEKEYFDEVRGRFQSSSVDSDDSFQIVFSDSPRSPRTHKPSDCDSEDSFIVFEDSPDSCYTSNDVFGEESESNSESDSDISDSGVSEVCKMSHVFSRTVSDLTDDSMYNDDTCDKDEVDCAARVVEEIPLVPEEEVVPVKPGLLINEARKLLRKDQPAKAVSFSTQPPKVHVMRVWTFAARQARAGHWERHALDRERFKRRICDVDMAVSWVLKPQHRSRVMFQRFMPWWNALRRKELAEKKEREAEDKIRREKEAELDALRRELEEQESELKALEERENELNGVIMEPIVNGNISMKGTDSKTQIDDNQLILVSDKLGDLSLDSKVDLSLDSKVIKEVV